jgi:hypothetical protein
MNFRFNGLLMKLAVPAVLCLALSGSAAHACKEDYCANSKAPTTLNDVGGPQVYLTPPASPPDVPCDQQTPPMLESPPPDFDLAGAIVQARDQLIAEGADLTGANCGQIVERAVGIIGNGAGLLSKNYGNQYNGHSVDFIVMPDGRAWDAVSDCGGANGPSAGGDCCAPLPATTCAPNSRYMPYP